MAYIDIYRAAVAQQGTPVVIYDGALRNYDTLEGLMRYSVTPLRADATLATTGADVAFVFMGNVVARGDFKAHPAWQATAKEAGIRANGLGGLRPFDDIRKDHLALAAKVDGAWFAKATRNAGQMAAMKEAIGDDANNVADSVASVAADIVASFATQDAPVAEAPTSAVIMPEAPQDAPSADVDADSVRTQIAAATERHLVASGGKRGKATAKPS